ncbi:UNVERIFIED_CONTAM: hypothetical protein PYX00_004536 [Menopon gallinae]|uniref:IQ motif and ubiquitin-like domain-containing protein n=1 Tax=Menopon gallinae TaxID=328185 RepID=A0AAW2I4A7_9NEOP
MADQSDDDDDDDDIYKGLEKFAIAFLPDTTSQVDYGSTAYYGEEYGEDYYIPQIRQPSTDLEVQSGVTFEEKQSVKESERSEASDQYVEPEEEEGEGGREREEEEEAKMGHMVTSSQMVDRLTQQIFGREILIPKERTESEIKFETVHRDLIEEEMRKLIQGAPLKGPVVEKRKPLEKMKTVLTDVDTSGLYPQPKAVVSEVSFAFDEDEEVEKIGGKGVEADADIVKTIVDMLREMTKSDPQSIYVKNIPAAFAKIQNLVDEATAMVKKSGTGSVHGVVHQRLPELKQNVKNSVIQKLVEKLSTYEKIVELEEDEEETKRTTRRETKFVESVRRKRKEKAEKAQEVEKEEEEEEEEEIKQEVAKPPEVPEEKPKKVAVEVARVVAKVQKEVGAILPKLEPYEKVNWELLLSESEKELISDPTLRQEMEKYIEERKAQLLAERLAEYDKMARERRYRSKDPKVMLENLNLNVTMKFLLNSGETFTCAYRYFMPFKEIKEDLSGIFRVPPDVLIIYRNEVEVKDSECAHDLEPKIEPFDSVTFRLLTLDNDRWRLKSWHLELPTPDIITCTVETGKDHRGVSEYKDVVVEVVQKKIKKPFVGGYRDKCTGIEYHHAFSQSGPREPTIPYERMVSTDTQTAEHRSKCIDTDNDKGTQMSRSDYYVSTEFDKIITAKPYVDYDTWLKQKEVESKILLIQRYIRALIIRKFIKRMSEEYRMRRAWEEEQERKRILQREIRVKKDILNMVYPKTRADFEALYAMVERWRKAQVERIGKLKTEAPRKAELCGVLEKEIKLLEAIEVHRIAVAKQQKKKKELDFLAKVSEPVTWTGYRGMTIKMDTLKTQRARELRELYLSLSRDDLNYQDRIELLVSIKYALRVNGTRLSEELSNLLNRECEMLIRGVSSKKLEYLRRRIDHLFVKYFKEPDFNPEVAKYDPDYNRQPLRQNLLFCKMCHKVKLYKEFEVTARDASCNVCQPCRTTYNIAVPRIDLNPYRYILKCVRREEQKKNCYSSCAFILQDEDMRFLVENIWHSRSAISENNNLMDLRMPRWDTAKDWTPWNCILLTEGEAVAHVRSSPSVNYEKRLVGEVISKHELAKRHFQQMFATEERMRDSGKWANVVDVKDYEAPPVQADIWDLTREECLNLDKGNRLYEVHETRRKEDNYVKYM